MNPKEKARELVEKYQELIDPNNNNEHWFLYKQCALIAVNEMIYDDMYDMSEESFEERIDYLNEVEKEIKNYEIK